MNSDHCLCFITLSLTAAVISILTSVCCLMLALAENVSPTLQSLLSLSRKLVSLVVTITILLVINRLIARSLQFRWFRHIRPTARPHTFLPLVTTHSSVQMVLYSSCSPLSANIVPYAERKWKYNIHNQRYSTYKTPTQLGENVYEHYFTIKEPVKLFLENKWIIENQRQLS